MKIKIKGEEFKIEKSNRKNKEYVAKNLKTGKKVHFADPDMPEFQGTKRGDAYCARSYGIGNLKNTESANFWSRKLWSCKGKKSITKKPFFGRLK